MLQTEKLKAAESEKKELELQFQALRASFAKISNQNHLTSTYEELKEISTHTQVAVDAEIHSISIPDPRENPTDLRIIISTDHAADVHGIRIPINKGFAGKVFHSQKAVYINHATEDKRHYSKVDEAAGTRTGEGAIMTLPIVSDGKSIGVIQFMKSPGGEFADRDIIIAERFLGEITDKLEPIINNPRYDIPYITRVDQKNMSVCFTDINDYSLIATKVDLNTSVGFLNIYYRRLLDRAEKYEAILEEYIGDGIYLSFHHESESEAARRAAACAIEIQEEFKDIFHSWKTQGLPVGPKNFQNASVASGPVYDGLIGHPRNRRKTLIGPCVNRAAHLIEEGKSFGECVLICDTTHQLIQGSELVDAAVHIKDLRAYKISG